MSTLSEHPTVQKIRREMQATTNAETETTAPPPVKRAAALQPEWLRQLCLDAGADDAGFVDIARPELDDQRAIITEAFPWTRTLISVVRRMNPENVRTPARSVANLEFHHSGDEANDIARRIAAGLNAAGHRAANGAAMGFPMEADRWPARMWIISHKPVAVAAGLGRIGIHRNVIHPRFGNFILLATIVVDAPVATGESRPIDYNPCLECKLCVAACPTGAIHADGRFDFTACYTHNYREFMGGFSDWAETLAASKSVADYRRKFSDTETVSIWQSLGFGPNYKAAYCMAVCPAGEDVIRPFLEDRGDFVRTVVRPLQQKRETIYVSPNSDAQDYVTRRFPHKVVKQVDNGIRPGSIAHFMRTLPIGFQPGRAAGLSAVYHFRFFGDETLEFNVLIRHGRIAVTQDRRGRRADFTLSADSRTWLAYLRKEIGAGGLLMAALRGRLRFRGDPRLLRRFAACFAR
jgi:NAD-dependent dihydropyrimidine dehydrogenase PreA subunit